MPFFSAAITGGSAWLLIFAVAAIGVLHTMVPDHWVPITLIARDRKWTRSQTVRASLMAGTGHVVTTLVLGLIVWVAGVAFATRFGHDVDILSSLALIAFGLWVAIGSWREMHDEHGHSHSHDHDHGEHGHGHDHHDHRGSKKTRNALLLILGSSPMVEGIPAFFAAGKYGFGVIMIMAVVFAVATISTYVVLCAYSTASLQNVKIPAFEKYGEVISGAFIAALGLMFLVFPVL